MDDMGAAFLVPLCQSLGVILMCGGSLPGLTGSSLLHLMAMVQCSSPSARVRGRVRTAECSCGTVDSETVGEANREEMLPCHLLSG